MFSTLIGQEPLKRQLGFYVESHAKTKTIPFLLFNGARGLGKTRFAIEFSKCLLGYSGSSRPLMEINSSTIKNNEQFFEQIFIPNIDGNEITVLFDEAHSLPKDLVMALLTILNVQQSPRKTFSYRGSDLLFDFTRLSVLFATTELDQLFGPLKDRLTIIDFAPYNTDELAKIIKINTPQTEFADNVLEEISKTVRGNARSAVKRAKEIEIYCRTKNDNTFGTKQWQHLRYMVGIKPLGMTNLEIQILDILHKRGNCSLQMLSAVTGMSRSALQREGEIYLLYRGLMKIDGTRQITSTGIQILKQIEKEESSKFKP